MRVGYVSDERDIAVASVLVDPAVSRLTTNVFGRSLANGGDRPQPPVT
jgi:hypothetical protein